MTRFDCGLRIEAGRVPSAVRSRLIVLKRSRLLVTDKRSVIAFAY
jgi:hypothetical protein